MSRCTLRSRSCRLAAWAGYGAALGGAGTRAGQRASRLAVPPAGARFSGRATIRHGRSHLARLAVMRPSDGSDTHGGNRESGWEAPVIYLDDYPRIDIGPRGFP